MMDLILQNCNLFGFEKSQFIKYMFLFIKANMSSLKWLIKKPKVDTCLCMQKPHEVLFSFHATTVRLIIVG